MSKPINYETSIKWLTWAVRIIIGAMILGTFGAARMANEGAAFESQNREKIADISARVVTLEKLAERMPRIVEDNRRERAELLELVRSIDKNLEVHIASHSR